jgi:ketosteroid isomerase-like protein
MKDAKVLEEFIAGVRVALDPYFGKSDTTWYADRFADVATYFDPNSSGKLENDEIRRQFEGYAGQIPPFGYEIINPSVSVHGDTTVFTFNVEMYDKADGSITGRWNTTEVHRRTGDGWEMVHAHWSYTEPTR